MGADERKRIRELKNRSRARKKKQIRARRAGAAIILLGLIILIFSVLGKSCSSGQKAPEPTQSTEPLATDIPDIYGRVAETVPSSTHNPQGKEVKGNILATANPNAAKMDINQDYFKDSVFIGNSMVASMEAYGLLDSTDYFGKIGLNVSSALNTAADNGTVPIIDELDQGKQYKKIFFMFGENECAWPSVETFKADYSKLIKKAMRYQPGASIYLLSITPISKTASEASSDGANKENIEKFNVYIEEVAQKNGAGYVDIYSALVGSDGYLPEKAASDGIHFDKSYYEKMFSYMASESGKSSSGAVSSSDIGQSTSDSSSTSTKTATSAQKTTSGNDKASE